MNWGTRIFIAYSIFIAMIITMVSITFMQTDIHLEEKDYYQQGVNYQDRIEQKKNGERSGFVIEYDAEKQGLKLAVQQKNIKGNLKFLRPSDAHKDVKVPFSPNAEGIQMIPISILEKGVWKLKINWQEGETGYYVEKKLLITPKGKVEITG